ncbi:MAG: cytochrome c3 family protein [Nevskiales bacterium]|nr:cytochrome c3 family protein [Nevskiales bacterium]
MAVLLLGLCATGSAWSAPLERLLMPGKLTRAHADLEDDCSECHTSFSQTAQQKLCRDCHDKVDRDMLDKRGFHGLSPAVAGTECTQCHSEHKGRDADIVGLVPTLFDHAHTDFALEGAHGKLPCKDCHADGKPMRDAPGACFDCHRKDDVHEGQMGKTCQDCHGTQTWRKSEFDHDTTDFPLTGAHGEVACASCHADRRYENTPTDCAACHGLQDRHGGLFGQRCDDCHVTKAWTKARFDHAKTDFPLKGRHRDADCHACHTERTRDRELPTACVDCHRGSDFHQGRFGGQCADCHSEQGWATSGFDHDRDTTFPLRGAHRGRSCTSCHSGELPRPRGKGTKLVARACVDCHRVDDVHRGAQGDRCDACHRQEAWPDSLRFDHDLTRFPLVGMHATASCAECHMDEAYRATPQACRSCHESDDAHDGALGPDCAACHNPGGWTRWVFDHDRQTDFPLEGSHAQLHCKACHREPVERMSAIELGSGCYACHANDDPHRGGFGQNCERCHQASAFSDIRISSQVRGASSKEAR